MEHVEAKIEKYGLAHQKEAITSAIQEAIRIIKVKKDERDIPIGTSKLGGLPDMPIHLSPPLYKGRPLHFLAQLNMEQVKVYDKENLFPEKGILYVFYDVEEQPWGFEDDEGCFKILFHEGDMTDLRRIEYLSSYPELEPLSCFGIQCNVFPSLPEYLSDLADDEEEKRYWYLKHGLSELQLEWPKVRPSHQIFGHPCSVQNDVLDELCGDEENAVLLLQVDSDDEWDVMWGDAGMLYFVIEREQLLNKQFDQTKFSLQCH